MTSSEGMEPISSKQRLAGVGLCSLAMFLVTVAPLNATQGTLQLVIQGYGTIHGQLGNPTFQPNGTLSMQMTVNDQLVTSLGGFPTSASGVWVGNINGTMVSGRIQNVAGVVHICVLVCQDANFVGTGVWNGQLKGSDAAGNFNGAITFTNSPVSQVPVGKPIPVSGTWANSFPMSTPEQTPQTWAYTLFLAVALSILVSASRRKSQAHSQTD